MKSAGVFAAGWERGKPNSPLFISLNKPRGSRTATGAGPPDPALDNLVLIKHRIILQMQAVTLNGAFSPLH